jgi:DNA-directed RNA polymerase specialized sigma24 family protein
MTTTAALAQKWAKLNADIEDLRQQTSALSDEKVDVIHQFQLLGLNITEIAAELGLSRQTLYNLLDSAKERKS